MSDLTDREKRRAVARASYHRHKPVPVLSDKLCECGCGEFTYVATRTSAEKGWAKGQPKRFVHGHNRRRYHEPVTEASCPLCETQKSAEEFYVDKARPNGLSSSCRECRKASQRAKYETDPTPFLDQSKRWRKENRQKAREHAKATRYRRRAQMYKTAVEKIVPAEIYERDNWRCHICGKRVAKKDASLDHLTPLSKGGGHVTLNVRLAHVRCNVKRGVDRIPAQLLLQ